jgi:ribonuclease VapC
VVIDTSVILAIYLGEVHGPWCAERLMEAERSGERLVMSTVNLTEVLIQLRDLVPATAGELERSLLSSTIQFVPPDVRQAHDAAEARMRLPLNMGDCFAFALAKAVDKPLITLDEDFRKCGLEVVMPPT